MNQQRVTTFRKVSGALTALVAVIALGSCSSARKGSKSNLPTEIPTEISQQSPSQRYAEVCRSYGDWQDVQMPVKVSLTSPKSLSVSARAVMKRDEWISLSVRMLGFEVASVFVDRDSVHVVDRYHKAYLSEGLGRAFGDSGVSVGVLQDLLLGRGFLVGKAGGTFTQALSTAFEFVSSPEGLMILPCVQGAGFEYGFILASDANRVGATSVSVGEKYAAVATYTSPVETSHGGSFAGCTTLSMVKGKNISATLNWNFQQAQWNTGESKSWKRPSGYSRLDASTLISKLTKL